MKRIEQKLADYFRRICKDLILDDGLVVLDGPGHTREIAHLDNCRSGRDSAEYYAGGMATGKLDPQAGAAILTALASLQITDPTHLQYGGFRWYREETQINDSNAAFFILMPLTVLRMACPERIPADHFLLLDGMMERGLHWFAKECRDPILFYPNKILSDGALLAAMASVLGDEAYYRNAIAFIDKWEDYTERRGWGWGENCSVTYLRIILNALKIALLAIARDGRRTDLHDKLAHRIDQLMDQVRFHAIHEFVPTIRSYNFTGKPQRESVIWMLAGTEPVLSAEELQLNDHKMMSTIILFADELEAALASGGGPSTGGEALSVPRSRKEPIFDGSHAYTWIGKNGRIGSIDRFPVMPGSYQQDTWGLGWQSLPVGFCADGEHIAYLRWYVQADGRVRTHPAENQHFGYLNTTLFDGEWHPDVQTRSAQADNRLLTVRSITHLHHSAANIADEWVLHRFGGTIERYDLPDGEANRCWLVLRYSRATVAITALFGIAYAGQGSVRLELTVVHEPDRLRIRQELYAGEEKLVFRPRLEAGWGVVLFDEMLSGENIAERLARIEIADARIHDPEVPRSEAMQLREITLSEEGSVRVRLRVDPYARLNER